MEVHPMANYTSTEIHLHNDTPKIVIRDLPSCYTVSVQSKNNSVSFFFNSMKEVQGMLESFTEAVAELEHLIELTN